jgi:hypothetical protein
MTAAERLLHRRGNSLRLRGRVELWMITEPGAELASDFYFTREEAEAALEEARRRDNWHPEDAAALERQHVERVDWTT